MQENVAVQRRCTHRALPSCCALEKDPAVAQYIEQRLGQQRSCERTAPAECLSQISGLLITRAAIVASMGSRRRRDEAVVLLPQKRDQRGQSGSRRQVPY